MIELENKLREETRSRNKAEKKLKFLIKKLESKNISYILDDNKFEISQDIECQESVGSTKSSFDNVGNNCLGLRCSNSSKILSHSYEISQKCIMLKEFDVYSETLLKNPNHIEKMHCAKSREFEFSKSDGNRYVNSMDLNYILLYFCYQIILTNCSR